MGRSARTYMNHRRGARGLVSSGRMRAAEVSLQVSAMSSAARRVVREAWTAHREVHRLGGSALHRQTHISQNRNLEHSCVFVYVATSFRFSFRSWISVLANSLQLV